MKRINKVMIDEQKLILNIREIRVYKEDNNILFFEATHTPMSKYILTNDYLEGVSCFMKLREVFGNTDFWSLKITHEMKNHLNYKNVLYWLSGGDKEWIEKDTYKYSWDQVYEIYLKEYRSILDDTVKNSNTLKDVRNQFMKVLNLPTMYEFALNKNFIR